MRIRKFKTKYHKYLFQFDYCPMWVVKIKQIQEAQLNTWKDLSFYKDEAGIDTGWVFSSYVVYKSILEEFDPIVDKDVQNEMDKVERDNAIQTKREARLSKLPQIDELDQNLRVDTLLPLFPFQRQVVDFVEKAGGRALLALDMGMGKSCCSIGYGVYKNYGSVLVVCPSSVKGHWEREIMNFAGIKANNLTETEERGGWEIIGYPNLDKYFNYLRKREYQLIVLDECHFLKNKSAIRTKKAFALLKKARDVLFLSGTPILNRPAEIYNVFNFIRPMPFWGNMGFAMLYCGLKQDPFGRWDYTGASNLDDLKEKMSFMIKMNKKDYLNQLPDKTINIIETEMRDWSDYRLILSDYRDWLVGKKLNENAVFAEALTKINYLKQVVVENKNITEILRNFLENGKKMIVFSQYKTVIDKLHAIFEEIGVKLTGDTPASARQDIIDQFQNNGDVRVFFSTIKAGGVGITLTEADTVVFTDLSWTPSDHQQAEDRAYRIGQKNNVNIYYLITPKTIEEKIWKLLKRKETMINKIMQGERSNKVHIKSLIKNL